MKLFKKLLVFAFAACAVVTCAAALSACSEEKQADVTEIYFKNSSEESVSSLNLGEFPYGTHLEEIVPDDFALYAKYSDGSEKVLSESQYTIAYSTGDTPLESMPATPEFGGYTLTFACGDFKAYATFGITAATPSYTLSLASDEWVYGSSCAKVSVPDYPGPADSAQSVVYYAVEKQVYDALTDAQKEEYWDNGVLTSSYLYGEDGGALDVGQYYVFAYLPSQSQNYLDSYTAINEDCLVTVTKAQINLTQKMLEDAHVSAHFAYNADSLNDKTDKIMLSDLTLNGSYIIYDNTQIIGSFEWVEPQTLVDASDNGSAFAVKYTSDEGGNYEITGSVNLAVQIERCSLNTFTMSVEDGYNKYDDYLDVGHDYVFEADGKYDIIISSVYFQSYYFEFTYSKDGGEEQSVNVLKIVGGNWVIREFEDVGVYTITARMINDVNYYWFGTDGNTDPVTYTFEIAEKIPVDAISFKLYDSITPESGNDYAVYDAKSRLVRVDGWDMEKHGNIEITDAQGKACTVYSADVDGDGTQEYYLAYFGSSAVIVKDEGTYTFTAKVYPEDVYYWQGTNDTAITYTCEVRPAQTQYELFAFDEVYQEVNIMEDATAVNPPAYMQFMNAWTSDDGGLATTLSYDADIYVRIDGDGSGAYTEYGGKASVTYAERDAMRYFGTEEYSYQVALQLIRKSDGAENAYTIEGSASNVGNQVVISMPYIYDNTSLDDDALLIDVAAADLPLTTIVSESIKYYVYNGEDVIKIKTCSDDIIGEERVVNEVYMIIDVSGNYLGHSVQRTVYSAQDGTLLSDTLMQFRYVR